MSAIFDEIRRRPDGLVLPKVVANLTPAQVADLSNGCGTRKIRVPQKILGVNFEDACNGHDCCYSFGEDEEDKRISDRLFLYNLLVLVDEHCKRNGIVDRAERVACREAAFEYYKAVADWGKWAFYAHKDGPSPGFGSPLGSEPDEARLVRGRSFREGGD